MMLINLIWSSVSGITHAALVVYYCGCHLLDVEADGFLVVLWVIGQDSNTPTASNSGAQTPANHAVPGGTTLASSSLARTPPAPSKASISASDSKDIDVVDNLVRGSTASVTGSDAGEREVQEEEGDALAESFDRVNLGTEEIPIEIETESDEEMIVEPEAARVIEVEVEREVIVVADDDDETVMLDNTTTIIDVDADADLEPATTTTLNDADDFMEDPEPAFYIDVNPSTADDIADPILFDRPPTDTLLGDPASSGEEEEIILVPRKHLQPEPIGVPVEPEYVRAKDEDIKPKESLVDKFGGKKVVGKDGRAVATTSVPSKGKSGKASTIAMDEDEGVTPAVKGAKTKNKKQAKREKRKNKKEERIKKTEGIVRHKMPRMDSDIEWGSEGPPPADNELVTDEEDDALPRPSTSKDVLGGLSTKGLTGAKKREMELLMDYLENTVGVDSDEEEEYSMNEAMPVIGGKKSSAALTAASMAAFVKGMSGTNQVMIDDINDARQLEEEDDEDEEGWESSSGSELTDEETQVVGSKNTKSKIPGLHSQVDDGMDDSTDEEESELEDSTDEAGAQKTGLGLGWAVPASSDTDSDDDSDEDDSEDVMDGIFNGKKTWADATDDFISAMDQLVDDNDLVMGSGKKFEKNKLFNAIQNGDFGDDWATSESFMVCITISPI